MFGSKDKREAKAQTFEAQARGHYSKAQEALRQRDEAQYYAELFKSGDCSEAARLTRITGKPSARGWVF
jgi:hypothetical protein